MDSQALRLNQMMHATGTIPTVHAYARQKRKNSFPEYRGYTDGSFTHTKSQEDSGTRHGNPYTTYAFETRILTGEREEDILSFSVHTELKPDEFVITVKPHLARVSKGKITHSYEFTDGKLTDLSKKIMKKVSDSPRLAPNVAAELKPPDNWADLFITGASILEKDMKKDQQST